MTSYYLYDDGLSAQNDADNLFINFMKRIADKDDGYVVVNSDTMEEKEFSELTRQEKKRLFCYGMNKNNRVYKKGTTRRIVEVNQAYDGSGYYFLLPKQYEYLIDGPESVDSYRLVVNKLPDGWVRPQDSASLVKEKVPLKEVSADAIQ